MRPTRRRRKARAPIGKLFAYSRRLRFKPRRPKRKTTTRMARKRLPKGAGAAESLLEQYVAADIGVMHIRHTACQWWESAEEGWRQHLTLLGRLEQCSRTLRDALRADSLLWRELAEAAHVAPSTLPSLSACRRTPQPCANWRPVLAAVLEHERRQALPREICWTSDAWTAHHTYFALAAPSPDPDEEGGGGPPLGPLHERPPGSFADLLAGLEALSRQGGALSTPRPGELTTPQVQWLDRPIRHSTPSRAPGSDTCFKMALWLPRPTESRPRLFGRPFGPALFGRALEDEPNTLVLSWPMCLPGLGPDVDMRPPLAMQMVLWLSEERAFVFSWRSMPAMSGFRLQVPPRVREAVCSVAERHGGGGNVLHATLRARPYGPSGCGAQHPERWTNAAFERCSTEVAL